MSNRPLSRWQLELFLKCPRCFWLLRRYGVDQPKGYPLALNQAMDTLLKGEFDAYRSKGEPHPIQANHCVAGEDGALADLSAGPVRARLFPERVLLQEWRNNRRGVRWVDEFTGYTLFGAIDDLLEFPDGRLAVLDYKSSGAAQITVYPSYRFQLEVYTFLLSQMGYPTAGEGYLAYFLAVKDDGFEGRLPFRGTLVRVALDPEPVIDRFREAVAAAESGREPPPGEECDLCRWREEVDLALGKKAARQPA